MLNPAVLLERVKTLITTDRRATHGEAGEQLQHTADLWSAYLRTPINRRQVARMMELQKLSREEHGCYNPDDGEDALGYGTLAAMFASVDQHRQAD